MIRKLYNILKKLYTDIPYYLGRGYALPPMNLIVDLTYRCNLRCKMCYVFNEGVPKNIKELSFDEVKSIVDQMSGFYKTITYTGGEALVRDDIIEIIKYTKSKCRCSLLTNGVLLTEDICKQLVESGIDNIVISIDGSQELHNKIRNNPKAYQKSIEGVKLLQKYKKELNLRKPQIHFNTVIMPENIDELSKIAETAGELNIGSAVFQTLDVSTNRSGLSLQDCELSKYTNFVYKDVPSISAGKISANFAKIRKTAKSANLKVTFVPDTYSDDDFIDYYSANLATDKFYCKTPWNLSYISANGDMYPCFNYKIGNIRENKISKLWNNEKYKTFRKAIKKNSILPECIGCCGIKNKIK